MNTDSIKPKSSWKRRISEYERTGTISFGNACVECRSGAALRIHVANMAGDRCALGDGGGVRRGQDQFRMRQVGSGILLVLAPTAVRADGPCGRPAVADS